MEFSYVSHLSCPKCEATYDDHYVRNLCACGSPLLVQYDLDKLKKVWSPKVLESRTHDLWRYHELLPIHNKHHITFMGEGMTPLLPVESIGKDMGIEHLFMKDEGMLPTGT